MQGLVWPRLGAICGLLYVVLLFGFTSIGSDAQFVIIVELIGMLLFLPQRVDLADEQPRSLDLLRLPARLVSQRVGRDQERERIRDTERVLGQRPGEPKLQTTPARRVLLSGISGYRRAHHLPGTRVLSGNHRCFLGKPRQRQQVPRPGPGAHHQAVREGESRSQWSFQASTSPAPGRRGRWL